MTPQGVTGAILGCRDSALLEPLIKVMLQKLDVAAERYFERQQLINLVAIPGTILFLMLFWAFSGAGGVVVLLGLFLTTVEVCLAAGLFLLRDRYEDLVREWANAADAIEAHLNGTDVFDEWTEFLQRPANDPVLERMRVQCEKLPDHCPPDRPDAYCGAEGIRLLRSTVEQLRVGIISKAYADFVVWWAERNDRDTDPEKPSRSAGKKTRTKKKRKKKKKKTTARRKTASGDTSSDAVKSLPTLSSSFLMASTQDRVDREADEELDQEKKQEARDVRRAARVAKRATRKAVKQEKKQQKRAAMLDSLDDEVLLYEDDSETDIDDGLPRHTTRAPVAPPVEDPVEQYEEEVDEEQVAPAPPRQLPPLPAPSPKPPKQRRTRGMTEAAAIQRVLKAGFTAHDYDATQEQLSSRQGREIKPAEVVKAMFSRAKDDRKRRSSVRTSGPPKLGRGGSWGRAGGAFRIDGDPILQGERRRRGSGHSRTVGRVVVILAVLLSVPFATWRMPTPDGAPVVINGKVHHRILDKAPNVQHKLRTLFEGLFGNKPVMLLDGQRIYVDSKDYQLCWPESWSAIYKQGYSVVITAEARPLLFGGYSVATITSAKRIDRPVPTVTEVIVESPEPPAPPEPPERQWTPRRSLQRGMK